MKSFRETIKVLKKIGCNYITFCDDLNCVVKCKNEWQAKYTADTGSSNLVELETYYIPTEFEGISCYAHGVIIPDRLLHSGRFSYVIY